jgi:hypothetical protein
MMVKIWPGVGAAIGATAYGIAQSADSIAAGLLFAAVAFVVVF